MNAGVLCFQGRSKQSDWKTFAASQILPSSCFRIRDSWFYWNIKRDAWVYPPNDAIFGPLFRSKRYKFWYQSTRAEIEFELERRGKASFTFLCQLLSSFLSPDLCRFCSLEVLQFLFVHPDRDTEPPQLPHDVVEARVFYDANPWARNIAVERDLLDAYARLCEVLKTSPEARVLIGIRL